MWIIRNGMSGGNVISKHIKNVFEEGELEEKSNVQNLHIANSDKPVKYYNLDVIIFVGYRVKLHVKIFFLRNLHVIFLCKLMKSEQFTCQIHFLWKLHVIFLCQLVESVPNYMSNLFFSGIYM